jgi:hypothetical protein
MTTIDLTGAKPHNKGIRSLVTSDKLLIIVVDLTKPIGVSAKGSKIFATTNDFTGLPYGHGIFLNMVVGERDQCQQKP